MVPTPKGWLISYQTIDSNSINVALTAGTIVKKITTPNSTKAN